MGHRSIPVPAKKVTITAGSGTGQTIGAAVFGTFIALGIAHGSDGAVDPARGASRYRVGDRATRRFISGASGAATPTNQEQANGASRPLFAFRRRSRLVAVRLRSSGLQHRQVDLCRGSSSRHRFWRAAHSLSCGAEMVDEWRAELRPVCEPFTSATPVDPAGLPSELDHFCGFLEPVPGECEIGGSPMVGEVDGDQFILTYRGPDSELAPGQSDLDCSKALAVSRRGALRQHRQEDRPCRGRGHEELR